MTQTRRGRCAELRGLLIGCNFLVSRSHCDLSAQQVSVNHFLITLRIFISRRAYALIKDSHRILDPTPKNVLHVSERRRTDG